MTRQPDVEDIQTTRTEKLLAVVLTAFLLVGGIWTYSRLDDVVRSHVRVPTADVQPNAAILRENAADQRVSATLTRSRIAVQKLTIAREAYRTALEAHKPAQRLGREYAADQSAYASAQRDVVAARKSAAAAAPAAAAAERAAYKATGAALQRQARDSFLARLGFVLFTIIVGYALLTYMRRRASRWFPLAGSVVAFATILALVLASDYATDYFNPFQWGIAVVALIGIASTLLAYLALQRYLLRRVPQRRVRKRECPFCGYPVGTSVHCEGCGRVVVAPCGRCESPRRVGTEHCGVCGATS